MFRGKQMVYLIPGISVPGTNNTVRNTVKAKEENRNCSSRKQNKNQKTRSNPAKNEKIK